MGSDSTAGRFVEAGLKLFYAQGVHATGLEQIITEVGSTKTTFYNHFESKDALALACVRRHDALVREPLSLALLNPSDRDPVEALLLIWDWLGEWFDGQEFNGCFLIKIASEYPNKNHPCHIAAFNSANAMAVTFRKLAERAGARDPDSFAWQYMLLMQGTTILNSMTACPDPIGYIRSLARALIASEFPEKPEEPRAKEEAVRRAHNTQLS